MRARLTATLIGALAAIFAASPAVAQFSYTTIDFDACDTLQTYEDGSIDLRCDGQGGFDVFVSDGDARTDVDYGVKNEDFETFTAFNGVAETIEWFEDVDGIQAAALRFFIDVDGRKAQALVVSKVGVEGAPGCVVGVVDAALEQSNGIARGILSMAKSFDCDSDAVVIVPGASELVENFNGADD
jgi:hypothetical protein